MAVSTTTEREVAASIKTEVGMSRGPSKNQIFLGHRDEDLDKLRALRKPAQNHEHSFHKDVFGVKTRLSLFGIADDQSIVMDDVPFPDNFLYGEAIEYLGTLAGVDFAGPHFVAIELGAGFAPWLVVAYVMASNFDRISKTTLVAVEADPARIPMIRQHFEDNGMAESDALHLGVINKGISAEAGTLYYSSQSPTDWGGSLRAERDHLDYRGLLGQTVAIATCPVHDVIADFEFVDLMHFDIQGGEFDSIQASYQAIKSKVKVMVIGTHSRVIEGQLIESLRADWRMLYEKPCKFDCAVVDKMITGATTFDGTQVWLNKAFVDH